MLGGSLEFQALILNLTIKVNVILLQLNRAPIGGIAVRLQK